MIERIGNENKINVKMKRK